MDNDARDDCIGLHQTGQGSEHGDKYFYFGEWVRKE